MMIKNEILAILGEGVHTAFRKGADGGGAHEVWVTIKNMEANQYNATIEFLVAGLDFMGYEVRQKLVPPPHQNPDLPKLLRALGTSPNARLLKHNVILDAAADELEHWRKQAGQP